MMIKMAGISLHSVVTVANLFLCFLGSINNTLKLGALTAVYSQLLDECLLSYRTYKTVVIVLKNTVTCRNIS